MRRVRANSRAARPRNSRHQNRIVRARSNHRALPLSKRARGEHNETAAPFVPPEDWHEPTDRRDYQVVMQPPGAGYRHVVTPEQVQARLAELPAHFLDPLDVIQFSRMTRKKRAFPCYGLQWGSALYLYPLEEDLVEVYSRPPSPAQQIEARMYGGRWVRESNQVWKLVWSQETIEDFYLNNILIHELGHLLDDRNTRTVDRERYAEWFAIEYGYKRSRRRAATGGGKRKRKRRSREQAGGK